MAIVIGISQRDLVGESNLTELDIVYVPNTDFSQAVLSKRWECAAVTKALTNPSGYTVFVLMGILGVGNLCLLGKTCLDSYKKIRQLSNTLKCWKTLKLSKNDKNALETKIIMMKKASHCLYCQVLVLIATFFVAVLNPSNFLYLQLVLTLSCLIQAVLNVWFIILQKLLMWFQRR